MFFLGSLIGGLRKVGISPKSLGKNEGGGDLRRFLVLVRSERYCSVLLLERLSSGDRRLRFRIGAFVVDLLMLRWCCFSDW